MSKKHRGGPAPVPPGNKPADFPASPDKVPQGGDETTLQSDQAGFQTQDPQRRLGGYATAGEHPRQQPSHLNDGNTRGK